MNERRKHERYPLVVGSQIDSDEPRIQFGLTQDFSQNGARLLTQTPYAAGMNLGLNIFISETKEAECSVVVIRCKEVEGLETWHYEIAVKMKDPLDQQIVTDLIEAYAED